MFKILLALLFISTPAWAVTNQWRGGVGTQELDGTQPANLIGFNSYNHIVQPIDNLLSTYCNEYLVYASSTTLKVSSGSVVVSNSQGTIRLFLQDTSQTTLTSANLDTGSLVANTTYYVYATAATNAATSSTYFISASNTAPSGQTYYYQIGSFMTDANAQITGINSNWVGGSYLSWSATKSAGVVYQALTDGVVTAYAVNTGSSNTQINIATDSSSSPSTVRVQNAIGANTGGYVSVSCPVRKGDYYEVNLANGASLQAMYFLSDNR